MRLRPVFPDPVTYYGNYSTVEPFDLPMRNTMKSIVGCISFNRNIFSRSDVSHVVHLLLQKCWLFIGRRWEFVWGESGKNYSEEVIRSYICKHGPKFVRRLRSGVNITARILAIIHAIGSSELNARRNNFQFVRRVYTYSTGNG